MEPDFEATDSDCELSDQSSVFYESGGSDAFVASDDECGQTAQCNQKRDYASRRKDELQFLGRRVCAKACARLLGVGQTTLHKIRSGQRVYSQPSRKCPVHPSFGFAMRGNDSERWPGIVMYLWFVYHAEAEVMPSDTKHSLKKPEINKEAAFCHDQDPDQLDRHVNHFVRTLQTYNSDIDVHLIGPGTFKGERRHLQHGSRTELFFEYLVFCKARSEPAASYQTFLRVANKVVGPHLRSGHLHFRKPNEHSKCDVCTRLKRNLKFKSGVAQGPDKESAIKEYSNHVLSQWLDRQVYWSLRSLSQNFFQRQQAMGQRTEMRLKFLCFHFQVSIILFGVQYGLMARRRMLASSVATNCIAVMQDGMDQAKFRCPRVKGLEKSSKMFATLYRPRLHVAATWLHGRRFHVAVSDEDMPKDAACQIEQLARALDSLHHEVGSQMPFGLSCHSDNTYREMKNRHVIGFLMLLASLQVFRWTMASFLRVGHSDPA